MIFTGINIKDTKSYKDLSITLSPHLNVFQGKSDSGKSSFIKALLFLLKNKATKNIRRKKSEGEFFVELVGDEATIKRAREGSKNKYTIEKNGKISEFSAMKGDIPDEIKDVLRITDSNIQEQIDTYFLIDESPGNVSKSLNKVSGLSEIDRSLKALTTEINSINASYREKSLRVEEDKEKIKNNEWSIDANKNLEVIESLEDQIENLEIAIESAEYLVSGYNKIQNRINELIPESVLEDYSEIENVIDAISDLDETIIKSEKTLTNYVLLSDKVKNIEIIDLSEINTIQDEVNVLKTDISKAETLLRAYRSIRLQMDSVEEQISSTEQKLKGVRVCPLCHTPLKKSITELL